MRKVTQAMLPVGQKVTATVYAIGIGNIPVQATVAQTIPQYVLLNVATQNGGTNLYFVPHTSILKIG